MQCDFYHLRSASMCMTKGLLESWKVRLHFSLISSLPTFYISIFISINNTNLRTFHYLSYLLLLYVYKKIWMFFTFMYMYRAGACTNGFSSIFFSIYIYCIIIYIYIYICRLMAICIMETCTGTTCKNLLPVDWGLNMVELL